ncbi:MAG TPA: hypothetical protein VHP61_06135 [Acidobacteriota bacterium]|nr:hypothetical protein [Acidobacteriota bacterium]
MRATEKPTDTRELATTGEVPDVAKTYVFLTTANEHLNKSISDFPRAAMQEDIDLGDKF